MNRAAKAAGVALVATLLVGIGWGAHAPHSWDVDNIAPGSVLRALAAHFAPGWYSSYGPVPYLLVGALYLPVLLVYRAVGLLGAPAPEYPYGFANPELSIGALIVLARLLTVALALLVAVLAVREDWVRRERGRWLVPLLLIGSPTFVFYSRTSNVDLFYLAFLALAFHAAGRSGRRATLFAGAAAALAVCCKEQSAPLAGVAALAAALSGERSPGERLRALAAVGLAALVTYAIVWGLPFNLSGWSAHHRFLFEQARYPRDFPATPAGAIGLARRTLELLPVTLGWPVLLGVPLAVGSGAVGRGLGARSWGQALYLVAFLGSIGYVYPRFLLPTMLLALPVAARGWSALLDRGPAWRVPVVLVLLALAVPGGPLLGAVQIRDTRTRAAEELERAARTFAGTEGPTLEVLGNPRFHPVPPAGFRTRYVAVAAARAMEGPRADFVSLSSFDRHHFEADTALRRRWLDRLEAPDGDYRQIADIPPPRWSPPVRGLPVSPVVWIWARRGVVPRDPR